MTEEKPTLDISTWTKFRVRDVAYVVSDGRLIAVKDLMDHFKVVDYQICDGERTNPSGEPRP